MFQGLTKVLFLSLWTIALRLNLLVAIKEV